MIVEIGNPKPKHPTPDGAPSVTYVVVPDDYTVSGCDPVSLMRALWSSSDVTNLPEDEAIVAIAHELGVWRSHATGSPSWVSCDNPQLELQLQALFGCGGKPVDVEDTHWTAAGAPGIIPAVAALQNMTCMITTDGRDIMSRGLFGGSTGDSGTASGTTSTSLTDSSKSWTAHAFAGQRVFTGNVWGYISDNTSTSLTVDQWYSPSTPGGVAASTPSAGAYVIADGSAPAWFMAISADTTAISTPSTSTSLTGEIATASGGLVRRLCVYAHTAGTTLTTLTGVFTANSYDSLPVSIAKVGVFNSMVVGTPKSMFFETALSSSVSISVVGDQLTVTDSITESP